MKYINVELPEIDVINILNALSYFRNEISWHDNVEQKKKISMYFNFGEEYSQQYDKINLLHKIISTQANREMYNIINDEYFEGQRLYLTNSKSFKFIHKKSKDIVTRNKAKYNGNTKDTDNLNNKDKRKIFFKNLKYIIKNKI